MEFIVQILKAIFIGKDGEVELTTVDKVRKGLLWIILGAILTIFILCYWADDEDDFHEDSIEYVESSEE